MRSIVFSKRTGKEILRDPLTFVFCLGFPLVMLIIMTIVDGSIPKEAGMEIFHIENLTPGIAVFGLTFIMLFTCLQVSKDRATSFIIRLYTSPMRPADFIAGYTLPIILISVMQIIITFAAAFVVSIILGDMLNVANLFLGIIIALPSSLLFLSFGMLFGTILNEKAAPGICSIIITVASMAGGIWMDIDGVGGIFARICHVLPFYHGVEAVRMVVKGQYVDMIKPFFITIIYAVVVYALSVMALKFRMSNDVK